jgi:formyl-CoA transferase
MFKRWTRLVGKPELFDDARFDDDLGRGKHGQFFSDIMNAWCGQFTRAEALTQLEQARIPAGSVNSPREVLNDATIGAAEPFHEVRYPGVETPIPIVKAPVFLSRTPPRIERRPPRLGEHTDEVLREIGYSSERIAHLREQGVI